MNEETTVQGDSIAIALRGYAQNILVVIFGLLPLFFLPSAIAPFDHTKALLVIVGVFVAFVLYSLSVLRSGVISYGLSYPLLALWGVAIISFISSVLSGDVRDSLVGDLFSIHSTVFVILLALIPTIWLLIKAEKKSVVRMYLLFAASAIVLAVFHVARLAFGPEFLASGVFTSTVSSPVGSWNDLALFLGLVLILSLVTLEHLSMTKMGRVLFIGVGLLALGMLAVINFFTVWVVLGLTSLVLIVYALGKDRFTDKQLPLLGNQSQGSPSLLMSLVVFAVSALFIVGGATFGGVIAKYTNVSYVEVRPSLEATANITESVYRENAFLGIGPNKFIDAWRLHKDSALNTTPFWNTDFNAGNGYITTFFVTTGVFGGVAWIIFLVVYLITGVKRLLSPVHTEKMWYFIGVSSFVSAMYIWGMSLLYVPGVTILLLGALCTGVSLSAFTILGGEKSKSIVVGNNRRAGFVMTLGVIAIIIGSVTILYFAGRHYSSVYTFNQSVRAMQQGTQINDLERQVESAYQLSSSDVFARRIAEYQLARMNSLASLAEPNEEQQKQFESASVLGIGAAQQAIEIDALEPQNWSVLGGLYGVLASVGVEGAKSLAIDALNKSRELNPKNPLPYLEIAIVEARSGNFEVARAEIEKAIALKPNYTEAFYLLSQLDIAAGNVPAAIKSAQAMISLEPQNPARYYQLGVLLNADNNLDLAIPAFEQAIALDQNYANARYLLALAYDQKGRSDDAKKQLETVLALNPGNTEVINLIKVLNDEGSLATLRQSANQTVIESEPVTTDNGTVSTNQTTDTNIVNPVNTLPSVQTETETIAQ